MSHQNINTGKKGEDLAVDFLQQQQFTILHRNWRYARYEMDIIAVKNNVLHFIEVKTRRTSVFGFPEERVSKRKIKTMLRTGAAYQYENPYWKQVQYNILSIILYKDQAPEYFFIEDVYT